MAETNFLTYKGKPLVRKGKEIYYGDMSEKFVVRFKFSRLKRTETLKSQIRYRFSFLTATPTSL